jgi:hypothetical protein
MQLRSMVFAAMACSLAPAVAQELNADQLRHLVSGKTWAIAFYGDLNDKVRTAFWDFAADGKVCARLGNNPPGSRCADTGTWKLQGDALCWELGFLGKTDGFQAVCGRAKPNGDAYQFINAKNGLSLMAFRPHR